MSTTPEYLRPVRLPRRSRQGVVMGMDGWQIAFLTAAGLVVLIFVSRFGPLGLLHAPAVLAVVLLSKVGRKHAALHQHVDEALRPHCLLGQKL